MSIEELVSSYKIKCADLHSAHSKLRHNKDITKRLASLYKGMAKNLKSILKSIKLGIKQVPISHQEDVSSEEELSEYVQNLIDATTQMQLAFVGSHASLKLFGNSIKMMKRKNHKLIKEASKAYNNSRKKADKARKAMMNDDQDDGSKHTHVLEQEKIDMEIYEFCVDSSIKRSRSASSILI